jgi:transposase
MESAGTYHCRLAYFLNEHSVALSVVNPLSVKRFSQAMMLRTKTDRADSRLLRIYGESMQPKLWKLKADVQVEMQQLLNLLDQYEKQRGVWLNQLEALNHSMVRNAYVMSKMKASLEQLEKEIKEVEKQLKEVVEESEKEIFKRLQTIPGIGRKTAFTLIAPVGDMKEFDSARHLCSCFGLCPRILTSGTSVKGKTKICKMGMGRIRKLLYLCALSAKRCNRACRELYDRLIKQGKKPKLALIAVAGKLIKQAFSMITNSRDYVNDYCVKKYAPL